MGLKVAIQMDHPATINVNKDSTFALGLEAQKRGHTLFFYHPSTLSLENGKVSTLCSTLRFQRKEKNYYQLGPEKRTNLKNFDLVLMRQDFTDPLSYNATTHILDHAKQDTLILNDPTGVRESPEKILITHFPDLAPPTLITRDPDQIKSFLKKHDAIVLKPMNGFGGLDIYHAKHGDPNLQTVLEMFARLHPEPLIAQKYIPEVSKGDKRIIVVEGEPIAALLRVPQDGNPRANLARGGKPVKAAITSREKEICKTLKPELIKRGLVFVGLDVIGGYVTEINPKSPTGLQQIYKLQGIKCEEAIWDAYEERYKKTKGTQ